MKDFYEVTIDQLYYEIIDDFEKDGGIYTLHCRISNDSNDFRSINRIIKTDERGILYIGETKLLLDRLTGLKKSVKTNYETLTHIAGKYYLLIKELNVKYPINLLVLKVEKSDNPEEREKELLKEYTHKFGELPPFNSKSEFMTDSINKIKNESWI